MAPDSGTTAKPRVTWWRRALGLGRPEPNRASRHPHNDDRRFITWACVIILVLLVSSGIRGEMFSRRIDRIDTATQTLQTSTKDAIAAATAARLASEKASRDLAAAIAASDDPEQAARLQAAFAAIFQTQAILCAEFPAACDATGP